MQKALIAGDALSFDTLVPSYSAADGWTLTYRLVPRTTGTAISFNCSAAADGISYSAAVSSATTAVWPAGHYAWFASVSKAGERFVVDQGSIEIRPDPATLTAFDNRSAARQTLDALKAAYQSYASAGQGGVAEYSIGGRTMKFRNAADLILQIEKMERVVAKEEEEANRSAGRPPTGRFYTRFMS
jgi:hypothetical protein